MKILNDAKRRAVSLWQLSFLLVCWMDGAVGDVNILALTIINGHFFLAEW